MEQIQVHLKHVILPSNYSEKLRSILHVRTVARAQGFAVVQRRGTEHSLAGRVTVCLYPPATQLSSPGARQHSGRVLHPSSKTPNNDTQSLAQIWSLPVPLPIFSSILSCFHLECGDKQTKTSSYAFPEMCHYYEIFFQHV